MAGWNTNYPLTIVNSVDFFACSLPVVLSPSLSSCFTYMLDQYSPEDLEVEGWASAYLQSSLSLSLSLSRSPSPFPSPSPSLRSSLSSPLYSLVLFLTNLSILASLETQFHTERETNSLYLGSSSLHLSL